jgi:putative RecB family exonuclease
MAPTRYSHSRLSSYERCPYKYKLQYVDRVKPPLETTIELFLGSRVHDTLEWLYSLAQNGRVATRDELAAQYQTLWEAKWTDGIRLSKPDLTVTDYRSSGQTWLKQYWDHYQPFTQGITIDLESSITINLPGGATMTGKIDRLEKVAPGHFVIHDYKTNKQLFTQQQADSDRQLALYMLGIQQRYPDLERIDLVWHFVRFDEEVWSHRTPDELQTMATETGRLIETIETAVTTGDLPTRTSKLCDYCEYRPCCPEFAHSYQMHDDHPSPDAPTLTPAAASALVDELVTVKAETHQVTRALKERRTEIETQLTAYATETGQTSVFGTDYAAAVSTKSSVAMPDTGSDARHDLETLLKTRGLWEQVDQLSASRLKTLVNSDAVTEDVREAVNQYLNRTEKHTVRLRKRP